MASKDGKKKPMAPFNPERKNGKAWKQGQPPEKRKPKAQIKTEERQRRDREIHERRERRREEGMARRRAEREARDQLKAYAEGEAKPTAVKKTPKKAPVKETQVIIGRRAGKTTAAKKREAGR